MAPTASPPQAMGQSDQFLEFMERLSKASAVDRPVLIVGERGTGKELAAHRLHFLSSRWEGPFVALNCAALAPTLVESELFGHEAGAFTGAARRRQGRFEAAHTGSLFLDEMGTMPLTVQEKILRVVEYGDFERLGGSESVSVDTRLIGATNADLPSLAMAGTFKQDLLDRLSFAVLTIPPLRARQGDALLLARHFASRMASEMGLEQPPGFSDRAIRTIETHSWPGNVRELRNAVERAVHAAADGVVDDLVLDPFDSPWRPKAIPDTSAAQKPTPTRIPARSLHEDIPPSLPRAVRDLEIKSIKNALAAARHNQRRAAELLGLTYNQFRGLFRKYKDALSPDTE